MADLELVRRLVQGDHGLAVVAVARADGTVQASVVNAGVMSDGDVAFVARASAYKVRRLRESQRATIVFRAGWEWVTVEGPATIAGSDPQLLRDVFTAAGGTHDDWDEYDRVMAAEGRVAVRVIPERITSN